MVDDEFECPHCDKTYSSEGWLANHLADKHPEEEPVDEEPTPEPETAEEAPPEPRPRRTERTKPKPETPCDNHPDVEAVWESDGVTASVVRLCKQCHKEPAA